MSNTIDRLDQSSVENTPMQQDSDAGEYQSLRGCLVLCALAVVCALIFVACILLFGKPGQ